MSYNLILMIHIASAIVWVGASFIFSMSVFPSLAQIPNERMIVRTTIRIMFRYLKVTFGASVTLLFSAIFLYYKNYKILLSNPILNTIILTKVFIWFIMTISYIYAYFKTKQAKSICFSGNSLKAVDMLKVIANYIFVFNIMIGFVAIYFGVMLRS